MMRLALALAALVIGLVFGYALAASASASQPFATQEFTLVRASNTPWPFWSAFAQPQPADFGSLLGWVLLTPLATTLATRRRTPRDQVLLGSVVILCAIAVWSFSPIILRVILHSSGNLAQAIREASWVGWLAAGGIGAIALFQSLSSPGDALPAPRVHRGPGIANNLQDLERRAKAERGDYV